MFAFLKQSTASQSRLVGPFVDDTDFKTLETGLTIANTDVKLSKNAAAGVNKNSGGGTHRNNGMYSLTFDATDTNTVGELAGSISVSGALVVVFKFWVLEEDIYDALFGASANGFDSNARVDVGSVLGTAQTAGDLAALITTVDTVVDGIQTDLSNGTDGLGALKALIDTVDTVVDGIQTDLSNGTDGLGALLAAINALNDPTAASIADAVWDELQSAHTTAGSFGEIATEIASIIADTNELQTDWVNGGRLDTLIDAITTHLTDIKGGTFNGSTDSLEAIRDRGDAAWITGGGSANPLLLQNTTIATLTSQTDFTLTAGSADNDVYNNAIVIVTDQSTSTQKAMGLVSDYVGSTKQVILKSDPGIFTMAVGDTVDIIANTSLTLADIFGYLIEGTETFEEAWRKVRAVIVGICSVTGTTTNKFRDNQDTKDRVTATVDQNGQRTLVVTDGS